MILLTGLTGLLGAAAGAHAADRRSVELLDFSCSSRAGEHRLTLFGNGTVRLRERVPPDEERSLLLLELTPDELAGYRARLGIEAYDRQPPSSEGGPAGEWVEQCRMVVARGEDDRVTYRFSRVESLPLDLSPLISVADELMQKTRSASRSWGFPAGYQPRRGDVLVRDDGARFRIERFTGDRRGLELVALDSPLVLYVAADSVTSDFAGLDRESGRQ